jgi:hypothetical protein
MGGGCTRLNGPSLRDARMKVDFTFQTAFISSVRTAMAEESRSLFASMLFSTKLPSPFSMTGLTVAWMAIARVLFWWE